MGYLDEVATTVADVGRVLDIVPSRMAAAPAPRSARVAEVQPELSTLDSVKVDVSVDVGAARLDAPTLHAPDPAMRQRVEANIATSRAVREARSQSGSAAYSKRERVLQNVVEQRKIRNVRAEARAKGDAPYENFVRLNSRAEFRKASKNAQPNTVYEYDGFTYKTDGLGRGISSSGQLRLKAGGNRFHDDHLIGHQGSKDDIAFHAGADEFGFQGGVLNLSPGNKFLNIREYRAFERELKGYLQQGQTVKADFTRVFYPNNTTVRPDEYRVIYAVDGSSHLSHPL